MSKHNKSDHQKKQAATELPDASPAVLTDVEDGAQRAKFPVVGIGASAGGLAAFEAFFSGMPAGNDTNMAFVLVQHLAPDHKSILTDLIKRYTRMQVFEVENGMKILPNCVYIIPPNYDMALLNGTLQLMEPTVARGLRSPIDFFFRSLAQDQRERAICVVLSGTGTDGTLGVRAVKGEGGMVLAQKPETTEYDGMPRNAIATGFVDYVLQPAEMPAKLITYSKRLYDGAPSLSMEVSTNRTQDTLRKIWILLRSRTGHDFSSYKVNTIIRRIERRMALHQVDRLSEYLTYMQQTPDEIDSLFRDLLIGVTNFFRNPEAFAVLQTHVIPKLFAGKPAGKPMRIWICGCSTGEEAYSIAILIREHLQVLKQSFTVQIFATDIDRKAVEQARSGIYPASISTDVSPERLARYFTQDSPNTYRVQKAIRDLVVFSEQDVTKDPPFSKLDMVTCRNLMIYMNGDLQKKLIPLFHYALNPGGTLFLGSSETVGDFNRLFETVNRKWKIFLRNPDEVGACRPAMSDFVSTLPADRVTRTPRETVQTKINPNELIEQYLQEHRPLAGVLVNGRGGIVHIHGRTGKYLEPASGNAAMNILTMAREGLRCELTTALQRAVAHKEMIFYPKLSVKTNGDFTAVNLTVRPVQAAPDAEVESDLFLVIIEDVPPSDPGPQAKEKTGDGTSEADKRVAHLKQELRAKNEYLQTTIEEMQTANEELKSTNEELQSVNEELQSTNEEMETAKEELQSVNEELSTVNAELQIKINDLSRANNDMNNLMAGTGIGTLFLNMQLRIARFTPNVTQVINLIPTDIGRPMAHIASNLMSYDRLMKDVQAVLNDLISREAEVQTKEGGWFLMRVRPYRTAENVIEGVVITFVDITDRKRMENLTRMAIVVRDSNDGITMQNLEGCILAWNRGAQRMYGWGEPEAMMMNVSEMIPQDKQGEWAAFVQQLASRQPVAPFETQRRVKDGRVLNVRITVSALVNDAGSVTAIATTEQEITRT